MNKIVIGIIWIAIFISIAIYGKSMDTGFGAILQWGGSIFAGMSVLYLFQGERG